MKPLEPWRRELRGLIPRGFLRRDQSPSGVFASDYPGFPDADAVTARLQGAGYRVTIEKGVAHLDGTADKYAALAGALPSSAPVPTDGTLFSWSLARRLLDRGDPVTSSALPALGALAKRLDAGDERAIEDFSAWAARRQRCHQPVPAAAGRLIFCFLSHREGGNAPC